LQYLFYSLTLAIRLSPETGGCAIPRYSQQGISVLLARNPANVEIYSGALLVYFRHKNDVIVLFVIL
jgi:hypothetical protein